MGPLIEGYLKSCTYLETTPLRGFICVIEPLFQELMSNDIGKSFITAFGTSGAVGLPESHVIRELTGFLAVKVMSTYLHTRGGERNGSRLFSPLILIAHSLAGILK
jgi:hypothetical protein